MNCIIQLHFQRSLISCLGAKFYDITAKMSSNRPWVCVFGGWICEVASQLNLSTVKEKLWTSMPRSWYETSLCLFQAQRWSFQRSFWCANKDWSSQPYHSQALSSKETLPHILVIDFILFYLNQRLILLSMFELQQLFLMAEEFFLLPLSLISSKLKQIV